ncbi:MAG: hypothetical protein NVV59_07955 [Chitinophagaceae bacterium]|nr:hypothetical protein [Chitinophagaceae bacterium]
MKRHLLSFLMVIAFLIIATASSVQKNETSRFVMGKGKKESGPDRIELYDGRVIEMNELTFSGKLFGKTYVETNEGRIPWKEVRAFKRDGIYYLHYGGMELKRIIHGRINVYAEDYVRESTEYNTRTQQSVQRRHYLIRYHYQRDGGPVILLVDQSGIEKAVAGCKPALDMVNVPFKTFRKSVRKNRNYINQVFERFNSECK